jgi:pimeloyl-ACP methyl ester carboxylesterase
MAGRNAIFITGAWMQAASWDKFRGQFEAKGYVTGAPAWPYLDGKAADLRATVDRRLGQIGLKQIVDHYETIIRALPERPLIVGHSFGGLITQLLLDRGLGVAGVAIDPAPIAGVIPGPVSLAAAVTPLLSGPSGINTLSPEAFGKSFANTVPPDERPRFYDAFVVPTPSRIFYQAALMIGTRVNVRARRQPLLITVGELDRTVTPYLAKAAYNIQRKAPGRTDFRQFPGRSHFLCVEAGWEDVAGAAIDWAAEVGA